MIENLVLVSSILSVPVLAGALKDRSVSGTVRAVVKILAPTVGIFPLCYMFDSILQDAGVQTSFDPAHATPGTIVVIAFGAISYLVSMKLVIFGEKIGSQEQTGISGDLRTATEAAISIIEPRLEEHVSNLQKKTAETLEAKMGAYVLQVGDSTGYLVSRLDKLEDSMRSSIGSVESLRSMADKGQNTLESQQEMLEKISSLAGTMQVLHDGLQERYSVLEARIESLGRSPEAKEDAEEATKETKLTVQDGSANRRIGIEAQHEMASYLSSIGFEIKEGSSTGEADYIIRREGRIVAIGSNKAYMLYDEPKRMQRRISEKEVDPEIVLARKLQVPMVIFVTNRRNNRRWAHVVKRDDLAEWNGVSTPVMLAKDDEQSGIILQEEISSVLASFGAVA